MLGKEHILQLLRENQANLEHRYGVKRLGIFGSYAKEMANETSDIDVFVEFGHPIGFQFIEMVDYLESLLGREVDVLTAAGLKEIRIPRVARNIEESIEYV